MRFFDAHCDTIGKIWEEKADFAAVGGTPGDARLHVTLPGLRAAGVCAQVFASWVWSEKYRGQELEIGLAKVEAVRRLCEQHSDDLLLVTTGRQVPDSCKQEGQIAVVASLEGADPLQGEIDNLALFHRAGVRLLTLAWGDNAFCGATYGNGTGLTGKGVELVAACEEQHILIDVSHASDQAFADVCRVAIQPFVASHSNCRAVCPSPRNLTDEMIRALAERGGVVGISVAPDFLSPDFYQQTRSACEEFWRSVAAGIHSIEEAGQQCSAVEALVPRPPLGLIVDHVKRAINVGGEDCVGLGGDLDGIDSLPMGFDGVEDYPRIAQLLGEAGLTSTQVEKVCHGNFARVFAETVI